MKIYCSGIGGIGLSAYAAFRNAQGHKVLGSDRAASVVTDDLADQGIHVFFEQDGSHVPSDADLFVYSEAIPVDAPERTKAKEYGIRQISYFAALGELSGEYTVIAVCGTHGKSSTTSMAAKAFVDVGMDPSVIVGTRVPDLDGRNWRIGSSEYFVLEACEYRHSFMQLSPDIILLTSADGDHFDAYANLEEYQQAYRDFVDLLPEEGSVVTHGGDPHCLTVLDQFSGKIIDADSYAVPTLKVPGAHMQQNAQLVLAVADLLRVDCSKVAASLQSYSGCWRRMEQKGVYVDNILVIDDYGHHPLEVQVTISALKEAYPDRRLVCVFQPHTHHRMLTLYDDFLTVFTEVDVLIIPNIYDARSDIENKHVDLETLIHDIGATSNVEVINGQSLTHTEQLLRDEVLQPNDVLLCMGAGDITNVAAAMVS